MTKRTFRLGKISELFDHYKIPISAVTSGNGFVFVSGLPPMDHQTGELVRGDILAQTRKCLENVKAAVEIAGSSLDRIVKITVYVTNTAYFNDINTIYAEYFQDTPPARTFVNVGSWPKEFDIEIEAIALA